MTTFDDFVIPEPNSGCFLWTGATGWHGYGLYQIAAQGKRKTFRAHRLAWERANGPIPDGLYVCHRCDTRACVNPDHLFLGTHTDNMRDASRKGRLRTPMSEANRLKTHCIRGHEFTPENTRPVMSRGKPARSCRRCVEAARKRKYELRIANKPPRYKHGTPTHCAKGHPRGDLRPLPGHNWPPCAECTRVSQRESYRRHKSTTITLRAPSVTGVVSVLQPERGSE